MGKIVQRTTGASSSTKISWRNGKNYEDADYWNSEQVTVEFDGESPEEIEAEMDALHAALKEKVESRSLAWREEQQP